MPRPTAFVVVDLGFGDAGKGLITDYLVRASEARMVIRFNGGAQAGHNVIAPDGRRHTFSQFGSGTFVRGVRTHLASAMVVHPTALRVEAKDLAQIGEGDALARLSVDPRCRVTTPFQQASGRVRELLRGPARHGSCGVGVGETVSDSLRFPELTLHFGELLAPERLRERLHAQRARKLQELAPALTADAPAELRAELVALTDPALADRWLAAAASLAREVRVVADEEVRAEASQGSLVFEGAQGVLLDERFGFHPFTTYSRTTCDGALELLDAWALEHEVERIGVLRTHVVRHGAGPLPTEDATLTLRLAEPHNHDGPWQGHVRKGWPDLVLIDYALAACRGVDAIALTHLDALAAFPDYRYCEAYEGVRSLPLPRNIAEQEQLTSVAGHAKPRYRPLDARRDPFALAELVGERGAKVRLLSQGPRASDVAAR